MRKIKCLFLGVCGFAGLFASAAHCANTPTIDYVFLNHALKVVEQTTLKELPPDVMLRIAAFNGLGGNAPVGLETHRASDAELGVAFYLAGLSAYVYAQQDKATFAAIDRRIHSTPNHPARNWASQYILHTNLKTIEPTGQLGILLDTSKSPMASYSILGHRAAGLLLLRKSPDDVERFLDTVFASMKNPSVGLLAAIEYINIFKVFSKPELFNSTFSATQRQYDGAKDWDGFLDVVNVVDYITRYDAEPIRILKAINKIDNWHFRLQVLVIGAQFHLGECNVKQFHWFMKHIHQWYSSPKNALPEKSRLTAVITAFGDIESDYVGITHIRSAGCTNR